MARIYIASVFFLGVFGGMILLKNSRSCIKASLCSGSRSGASNLLLSKQSKLCRGVFVHAEKLSLLQNITK